MDMRTVHKLIENRRIELNTLASIYGIRDERVLEKSAQLDRILNVYVRKKCSEEVSQQILIKRDGLRNNDQEYRRELLLY
ncbi:aspartyl-phosphate phosphatase Spo0E family protein [Paenibacillus crassostreae]|uniref:Aspartyl-phosphate phosphatase Spo0E family protein n=1 Tax=Paenibacillus crassostreae TaxID=1763538 RepID=A0A167B7N7_9BACL|nr:aspartyl-phosphate phosphatase Spo0E family protein [Paenibacillus crassostreae]AOZ93102.1 hypothetical protein LPB68_13365 [Paenibacillus crassostreae]OAB71809.1 hypothetical protein PNBC_17525 [Paenibacillus crassostreae]